MRALAPSSLGARLACNVLSTAKVLVNANAKKTQIVTAIIIDSGSQVTLITTHCALKLGIYIMYA